MVLIETVRKSDKLIAAKKFLEVFLTLRDTKYSDRILTILAYYCLYGISDETDAMIREEYFPYQEFKWARHSIYNVRTSLRKLGLLKKDPKLMIDRLDESLRQSFAEGELGYAIKFETLENNK